MIYTRAKGYLSIGIICFAYWIIDSIWSFLSFDLNLKKLMFSEPTSYLDTFLLKVPPYQIVSRLMVITLFFILGRLVIEFIIRKQESEKQVRDSEEKFKALFNSSNDGILLAEAETKKLTMCNPKICDMLRYTPDELTKLTLADIHPKKTLAPHLKRSVSAIHYSYSLCQREGSLARSIPCIRLLGFGLIGIEIAIGIEIEFPDAIGSEFLLDAVTPSAQLISISIPIPISIWIILTIG